MSADDERLAALLSTSEALVTHTRELAATVTAALGRIDGELAELRDEIVELDRRLRGRVDVLAARLLSLDDVEVELAELRERLG